MNAQEIEARLRQLDFHIASVSEIEHGWQIRLGCGAVINVYDNGAVLVTGKWHPECQEDSQTMLKRALPRQTRWCMKSA